MTTQKLRRILATAAFLTATISLHAQIDHGHINAGAVGTTQNDKLIFANAPDFSSNSGYVKTLTFTNGGTYAGYYQANVTFTALPRTSLNGGPDPSAPAFGSFIQVRIVSVDGPAGGAFGFWDAGATAPTISVASGGTSSNMWKLSQSDGSPGSDPYGHIHGRRLTVTKPGIYKVGFKLFDTSTNGVAGGPIHTPSDVLTVYFQGDVNLLSIEPDVDHAHIRFSAPLGTNWQLQTSTTIGKSSIWTNVGPATVGDDYFHEFEHDGAVIGNRFYRVKVSP